MLYRGATKGTEHCDLALMNTRMVAQPLQHSRVWEPIWSINSPAARSATRTTHFCSRQRYRAAPARQVLRGKDNDYVFWAFQCPT